MLFHFLCQLFRLAVPPLQVVQVHLQQVQRVEAAERCRYDAD